MDRQYALQISPQYTRAKPRVSCCDVLPNLGSSALFPCLPAAQVASSLGYSYNLTLASTAIFSVGGIFCYGVGMTMHQPVFDWGYDWLPFLVAWMLYALGLWATVVVNCVLAFGNFLQQVTDETGDKDWTISKTAIALVAVHAVAQIFQVYDVLKFHRQLRQRADVRSLRFESICCQACSLAYTVASVKKLSGTSVCNMAPLDELPGYSD